MKTKNKQQAIGSPVWAGNPAVSFTISYAPFEKAPAASYTLTYRSDGEIIFTRFEVTGDQLLMLHAHESDRIINGIRKFWNSKHLYKKYNFLWKRGFFFYGPQGSGKSSAIRLIIDEVIANDGIAIYSSNPGITVDALAAFRAVEPNRPIVVIIEDIDDVIENGYETRLLALLDGEHQVDNVIYIATTNHPDKVPARIINRPSRFDEIMKIDVPGFEGRKEFLKYKLPELTDDELNAWASASIGFSVAHLKELVVSVFCIGNTFEDALEKLKKMRLSPPSEDDFNDDDDDDSPIAYADDCCRETMADSKVVTAFNDIKRGFEDGTISMS